MIITVISFLALINAKRVYEAEIDVLILPKNGKVAADAEQILASAQKIPLALSFYDKIIENDPEIEDQSEGLGDFERKKFWNRKIETQRVAESEIIKIKIYDKNQFQAESIALETARNLAQTMARYYNIRTELDARILDGPIVDYAVRTNWFFLFLESLIFGVVAGLLNYFVVSFIPDKKAEEKISRYFPSLNTLKFGIEKEPVVKPIIETEQSEKEQSVLFSEIPATRTFTKKAPAPDNLPTVEENFSLSVPKSKDNKAIDFDGNKSVIAEEAKEILNRLLRGEL